MGYFMNYTSKHALQCYVFSQWQLHAIKTCTVHTPDSFCTDPLRKRDVSMVTTLKLSEGMIKWRTVMLALTKGK